MSGNACSNSRIIFFLLTGCDHERLPSRERGRHVQQLPCWRRAVGCDGVPGGRRVDRHRDSHEVGGLCCAGTSSVNTSLRGGQEVGAPNFLRGCLQTLPSPPHLVLREAGTSWLWICTKYIYTNRKIRTI